MLYRKVPTPQNNRTLPEIWVPIFILEQALALWVLQGPELTRNPTPLLSQSHNWCCRFLAQFQPPKAGFFSLWHTWMGFLFPLLFTIRESALSVDDWGKGLGKSWYASVDNTTVNYSPTYSVTVAQKCYSVDNTTVNYRPSVSRPPFTALLTGKPVDTMWIFWALYCTEVYCAEYTEQKYTEQMYTEQNNNEQNCCTGEQNI